MLEKGPLTQLLGGQDLLNDEYLKRKDFQKKKLLNCLLGIWCGLCFAALSLIKKWKMEKLNSYQFILNK